MKVYFVKPESIFKPFVRDGVEQRYADEPLRPIVANTPVKHCVWVCAGVAADSGTNVEQ